QEIHGEVHARELATRHGEVPGHPGADGQADGVEVLAELLGAEVAAHVHAGAEHDALSLHLLHSAGDEVLLELEVRDAVHEQAADRKSTRLNSCHVKISYAVFCLKKKKKKK